MAEAASESALVEAVRAGDVQRVRTLLDAGADPNAPSVEHHTDEEGFGYTEPAERPLHVAAAAGHAEICSALIEHGAELDPIHLGATPLGRAAGADWTDEDKRLAVVRELGARGADVNAGDAAGKPLAQAVKARSVRMVELLLQLGAKAKKNAVALTEAADRGNVALCRALIPVVQASGADASSLLGTALVSAAREGHAEAVGVLLAAGADPNASDGSKNALHWNAMWGKRDRLGVLSQLVEHGAELDKPDGDGVPALVWAVAGKHADLVEALIDAGADPNGNGAFPPLFQAAYQGKAEFAELLLAKGADPALTHEGKDAASWAEKGKHLDLAERLRAASK